MKIRCKFIKLYIEVPNDEPIRPYIVSFKKGLLGKWHYVIDSETKCPKLYFGDKDEVTYEGLCDINTLLNPKSITRKENDNGRRNNI